jgi:hypothetical protein
MKEKIEETYSIEFSIDGMSKEFYEETMAWLKEQPNAKLIGLSSPSEEEEVRPTISLVKSLKNLLLFCNSDGEITQGFRTKDLVVEIRNQINQYDLELHTKVTVTPVTKDQATNPVLVLNTLEDVRQFLLGYIFYPDGYEDEPQELYLKVNSTVMDYIRYLKIPEKAVTKGEDTEDILRQAKDNVSMSLCNKNWEDGFENWDSDNIVEKVAEEYHRLKSPALEQEAMKFTKEDMINFSWWLHPNLNRFIDDQSAHFEGKYLEIFLNQPFKQSNP